MPVVISCLVLTCINSRMNAEAISVEIKAGAEGHILCDLPLANNADIRRNCSALVGCAEKCPPTASFVGRLSHRIGLPTLFLPAGFLNATFIANFCK
jgi:hypothetical protein